MRRVVDRCAGRGRDIEAGWEGVTKLKKDPEV
jgi:hypothetical protein